VPAASSAPTPLDEIFEAITDEISALRQDSGRSIDVVDGRRLHRGI
jgi:hypothetical protein